MPIDAKQLSPSKGLKSLIGPESAAVTTFVFLVATVLWVVGAVKGEARNSDLLVAMSFLPTILASALLISNEAGRRPFSLHLMHLLFVFMYYALAGLVQYLLDTPPYCEGLMMGSEEYLRANLVMLAWLASYSAAYYSGAGRAKGCLERVLSRRVSRLGAAAAFCFGSAALLWLAYAGFFGLLTRAAGERVISSYDGYMQLLVQFPVQGIPIAALVGLWLVAESSPRAAGVWIMTIVIAAGVLLTDNPLANARFWTGMALIAILAVTWLRKHRFAIILVPALLAGNLFVLPLLNQGRSSLSAEAYIEGSTEGATAGALAGLDADAYSGVMRMLRYTESGDNITWGRQLLGCAFSWIPRDFWQDKPIGSGTQVAGWLGYRFTNLAAPLPAEALINFGYVGILLFAWPFGRILNRLDELYESSRRGVPGAVRLVDVMYPFWLGMIFFVSRGDLMSSLAYTVAISASCFPFWLGSRDELDAVPGSPVAHSGSRCGGCRARAETS